MSTTFSSDFTCPACHAPAEVVDKRVRVLHARECPRRPGSAAYAASLRRLREYTDLRRWAPVLPGGCAR